MIIGSIATMAVFLTTASTGDAAVSDEERNRIRGACMADVMRLCPREASARDRVAVRACLKANFAKTSQSCQSSLRAVAAEREGQSKPNQTPARPPSPPRAPSAPPAPKS